MTENAFLRLEILHNAIKYVLGIKESDFNEKYGSKFSHLLTVRAEVVSYPTRLSSSWWWRPQIAEFENCWIWKLQGLINVRMGTPQVTVLIWLNWPSWLKLQPSQNVGFVFILTFLKFCLSQILQCSNSAFLKSCIFQILQLSNPAFLIFCISQILHFSNSAICKFSNF